MGGRIMTYYNEEETEQCGEAMFQKGNSQITGYRSDYSDGYWIVYKSKVRQGLFNEDITKKVGR